MIVRIDYPEADVRLDLWGGVGGAFAGLDRFGRVVDQRWQNDVTHTPADADRYQYGYDRDSSRTWKRNVVSGAASAPLDEFYAYDRLNRLATMQRGTLTGTPPSGVAGTPIVEQGWSLDPTGNWGTYLTRAAGTTTLDQARTANSVNEIASISNATGPAWAAVAYDAAGNTTAFPQPADPAQGFTATYDAWNRMTGVKDGSDTVAAYRYDGRNRRVVNERYASGTPDETRHVYFTDAWQAVEERVDAAATADVQYVWGLRYVDELVCRDDATPMRIYACQDANFNVTALLDAAGAVLQRFVYEPYGADSVRDAAWAAASDAYAWAVRFQGCKLDTLSNLYCCRSRQYSASLGRWLRRDSLWSSRGGDQSDHNNSTDYVDGGNLYQFLLSQPVNRADPDGKESEYNPDIPSPIPSGDNLIINISKEGILGKEKICGEIRPKGYKNVVAKFKWAGICIGIRMSDRDIQSKLETTIDQFAKENAGLAIKCDKGYTCCGKARFSGTYGLTVKITPIPIPLTLCTVSGTLTGDFEFTGEIGTCRKG